MCIRVLETKMYVIKDGVIVIHFEWSVICYSKFILSFFVCLFSYIEIIHSFTFSKLHYVILNY